MKKTIAATLAGLGATLLLSATSAAAISKLDIGDRATLGPEGTSLTIPVTFQCDVADASIILNVHVTQAKGHRIADGIGIPTASCTGAAQSLNVLVNLSIFGVPGVIPFGHGNAAAQVDGFVPGQQLTVGPRAIKIVG